MVVVCDAYNDALSRRRAPIDWPIEISAPTLEMSANELIIHINMPIEPTAATASLPRRPIQRMSTRL